MIRYFKKSFVRYLAYGLAIALLSFVFGIIKANAETTEFQQGNAGVNDNYSLPYSFNNSVNGNYTTKISVTWNTNYASEWVYDKPYVLIEACTTGEYTPSNYSIVRTYAPGQSCPNSCFEQQVSYFMTQQTCPAGNGTYLGKKLYILLKSQKWNVGSGNTPYFSIDDSITFKSTVNYSTITTIYGIYMTDDNFATQIQNAQNETQLNILTSTIHSDNQAIISAVGGLAGNISNVESSVDDVKDSIDNVKDTITDTSSPDNLNALSNAAGWLPAGPVDSILNLPLTLLNNVFSNLSKTCAPVELPLPFVNSTLQLPCLNSVYAQIDGVPTWINGTVGVVASAFILFYYLMHLYKYIDDTLTFRENNYIDNWSGV